MDHGPKLQRKKSYYTNVNIQPMCANCHSLQHRTGEHLENCCGQWHRQSRAYKRKYENANDMFSTNCMETYQLQKQYYLKWICKDKADYKCAKCGVSTWKQTSFDPQDEKKIVSTQQKTLLLELHHKDRDHKNSLVSNLELLCPNCHRLESA